MGLVTPMAKNYDWLAQVGHAEIVPAERGSAAVTSAQ
jgi:hypothetical protein